MDKFYKFASENPWLTFFIIVVICECIYKSFQAIGGK